MASRDKKSSTTVGRKQTTTASPPAPASQTKENVEKPAEPTKARSQLKKKKRHPAAKSRPLAGGSQRKRARTNLSRTVAGRLSSSKELTALIKNGVVATTATVIRKRPVSLRERSKKAATAKKPAAEEQQQPPPTPVKVKQEADLEESPSSTKPRQSTGKRMKKGKDISDAPAPVAANVEEIVVKKEPEEDVEQHTDDELKVQLHHRLPRSAKKSRAVEKTQSEGDLVKKKLKKEPIESVLAKVDMSDSSIIDHLDLNVSSHTLQLVKDNKIVLKRRHSIEQFPLTLQDVKVLDDSAFSNPKMLRKRSMRPRPSSESSKSRTSPYTTRSDSIMRMLRNGKTRRHQQFPLFDGLDSEYKMRRRIATDFSGSEASKMSGYESDSSLSSSIQEAPEASANEKEKDKELLIKKELLETLENNPPDTVEGKQIAENFSAAIKRSLSMEAVVEPDVPEGQTDTNSNLCTKSAVEEEFVPNVPKLLGIMKQVFNDKGVTITEESPEVQRRKTRSSVKKSLSPEKDVTQQQPLPSTTISTLSVAGIALGPEITITAEEVQPQSPSEEAQPAPEVPMKVEPPPEEPTLEEAEAELVDILNKNKEKDNAPMEEPTPSTSASVNGDSPDMEAKTDGGSPPVDETPESLAEKSQILKALGLQTLQEAEEARKKQVPKENYTGTLKTVIKLNRCSDKKKAGRNPIKMTLQKKGKHKDDDDKMDEDEYKIMKEGTSWKHHGGQSSDTAGAQRKSHYSNRSNMDGSSEHTSDGDTNNQEEGNGTGSGKLLVIPEKASSFSIHPGRLCKDECSYCFGKFGLFDTPCHIAQMKTVERQDKILANEKHLTRDSCLCDACYRHVDRKANLASYGSNKCTKRNALIAPAPRQNHCHVLGCTSIASNILKRKWLIKMRKEVCQVINIDLDNPGLHSIPICKTHYAAVEHLMVCAICKRRLARNHIYYLGSETNDLQLALNKLQVPVVLNEKPVVCKMCRCFATIISKGNEEQSEATQSFYVEYKKRLLHYHNITKMNEAEAAEYPILPSMKEESKEETNPKKRKRDRRQNNDPPVLEPEVNISTAGGTNDDQNDAGPSSESRPDSPNDYTVDYKTLIPNIAMECATDSGSEVNNRVEKKTTSLSIRRISKAEAQEKKRMRGAVTAQRLGTNPSISIRQMFPGEEDVPLNGTIEFNKVKERTPEGWEKCTSTIQYDSDTKQLWQELQKPYGNQSSFLRHLVLLEKYFRNGDLILSPRASNQSINYTESVQNRLRSYDNISSAAGQMQPISMLPFNNPKMSFNAVATAIAPQQAQLADKVVDKTFEKLDKSHTNVLPMAMSTPNANVIINQAQLPKNTPLTLSEAKTFASTAVAVAVADPAPTVSIPVIPITPAQTSVSTASIVAAATAKVKPPGLISLHQSNKTAPTTGSAASSVNLKPQSQKIKFPITKNWRPKLIPIDPTVKTEKKPGLVQVISGGKPYHITVDDYKKMCAIKRTYDLRQKRLQETLRTQSNAGTQMINPNSLLKSINVRATRPEIKKSPPNSDQEENSSTLTSTSEPRSIKILTAAALTQQALGVVPQVTVEGKMPLNMPKIPKSLTVIPQTVTINRISRPNTPDNAKLANKAKS